VGRKGAREGAGRV